MIEIKSIVEFGALVESPMKMMGNRAITILAADKKLQNKHKEQLKQKERLAKQAKKQENSGSKSKDEMEKSSTSSDTSGKSSQTEETATVN